MKQALLSFSIVVAALVCSLASTAGDSTNVAFKRSVVEHYATLVFSNYEDALVAARRLETEINRFVAQPSAQGLQRSRAAWIEARRPYLQTEVHRFYDGPIEQVEGFVNAWPIDENFIDSTADAPNAGIINDPVKYPAITTRLLSELNEQQGERSITTGFHAIEFLLWGQDMRTNGPGDRPWTDYTTATNAERRAAYLRTATELLVSHLQQVSDAWAPEKTDNYREQFLSLNPDVALGRILKGMGSLSGPELSGERLTVAYQTKEQEDEHSCFSDTTHLDFRYDALGIENIFFGRYVRTEGSTVTGPSLQDLLIRENPALAATLETEIRESVQAARAIPAPFDQAVLGSDVAPGRVAVRRAIKAFQSQADTIAKAAAALGIPLNL